MIGSLMDAYVIITVSSTIFSTGISETRCCVKKVKIPITREKE